MKHCFVICPFFVCFFQIFTYYVLSPHSSHFWISPFLTYISPLFYIFIFSLIFFAKIPP